MHNLTQVIEHYEDIKIEHHYKIWLQVGRVKKDYIHILRLDKEPVRVQSLYTNKMKAKDIEITDSYFQKLKEKTQDDELDILYLENEKMAVTLANQTLKKLSIEMNNIIESGNQLKLKEAVVILKTIELYATKNKSPKEETKSQVSSLAMQLLKTNNGDNKDAQELQSTMQEATKLRLPATSL
jgi:hypothetical protein